MATYRFPVSLNLITTSKVTGVTTGQWLGGPVYLYSDEGTRTPTIKRPKPQNLQVNWTDHTVNRYVTVQNVYKWAYTDDPYSFSYKAGPVEIGINADIGTSYRTNSPVDSIVNGRLRSKIRDSNLNLAQSLAEYRQTAKLFGDTSRDMVKYFRALRGGRLFSEFIRTLQKPRDRKERDIANQWLKYQYGLKPVISDIHGSCELLGSKILTGFTRTVRARAEERWTDTVVSTNKEHLTFTKEERHVLRSRVSYQIKDPTLRLLSQLGFTNPLLLAWELIPYSFVVDLMIPIGNWLEALDALQGVDPGSIVNYSTLYRVKTCKLEDNWWNAQFYRSNVTANRTIKSFVGMPRLAYKPSTSLTAVVNGLALLRQLKPARNPF